LYKNIDVNRTVYISPSRSLSQKCKCLNFWYCLQIEQTVTLVGKLFKKTDLTTFVLTKDILHP